MLSNTNRICYTCGKAYRFCKTCDGKKSPSWLTMVCSSECNDIFNTIANYNLGRITKAEARKQLNTMNAGKKKYASDSINNTIEEIFTKDKKITTIESDSASETDLTDNVVLSE